MLFNTRRFCIGLFLLLSIVLAGCEPASDTEKDTNPKFYLLSPIVGNDVLDNDENLRIKYSGDVNKETISVVLNGVEIKHLMDISDITGRGEVNFFKIRNQLILGTNTVILSTVVPSNNPAKPGKQFSKTFTFFYDDQKPHIEITCVRVDSGSCGAGGAQPSVGSTLTIEGNIIDISNIQSLQFNYVGGIVNVRETKNATLGRNEYTNTRNSQGYRTFIAEIPSYPDVTIPTGSPHFSYTVVDVHNQLYSEEFLASGTQLTRKLAMQVNEGFLNNINPLVDGMIGHVLELPLLVGGLENLVVKGVRAVAPLTISENTLSSIRSKPTSADYANDRVMAVASYGSSFCNPALINLDAGRNTINSYANFCALYLRDIAISGLHFDTHFSKGSNGETLLNLTLDANEMSAFAEVAGVEYLCTQWVGSTCMSAEYVYKGGITSRMALYSFQMKTTFQVFPAADMRFSMKRVAPISIDLRPFSNGPDWVDGACIPNDSICRRSSTLAWAAVFYALGMDVFNFQALLDGNSDIPNSNGVPDKKEIVPLITDMLNTYALPLIDGLLTDDFTPARAGDADDLYLLSSATKELDGGTITDTTQATSIGVAIAQNAMTISQGGFVTDPFRYSPTYAPLKGGLGSIYQSQGCFVTKLIGSACGTGFKEQLDHYNEMDLVFSIPANSINQYLLSTFQTGNLHDLSYSTLGTALATLLPDDVAETDNLSVNISYTQTPLLHFSPNRNGGINPCFSVAGFKFCPGDPGALGLIKVTATNVDIDVVNSSRSGAAVISANMDVTFDVYVTSLNTSGDESSLDKSKVPVLGYRENSLVVRINNPSQFADTVGVVSSATAAVIQAYLESDDFQDDFSKAFRKSIMYILGGEKFKNQDNLIIDVSNLYDPVLLPIPQEILDIEPLLAGIAKQDMSVLLGDSLPRKYGVIVRQFKIEENGTYLSVGLDIRNTAANWTPLEKTQHFFEIQVVK